MITARDKTLEELDGKQWGEPEYKSSLAVNCHRLRRVLLKNFTVEDLRLMIGQELGLEHLVPLALEQLELNPFVEGDLYPGDLLKNVLGVKREFWDRHSNLRHRIDAVIDVAIQRLDKIDDEKIAEPLKSAMCNFG